jgi:hypothetical protein
MELTVRHPVDNDLGLTPACAGCDTDAFYDVRGGNGSLKSEAEAALRICAECPLTDMCLEWALHHEEFGIWGGTIAPERERMRRKRGIRLASPEVTTMDAYFNNVAESGVRDNTTPDLPDGWWDFKKSDKWIDAGSAW